MNHTTHHHACDCREAEFAAIAAERDQRRRQLSIALSALVKLQMGPGPSVISWRGWKLTWTHKFSKKILAEIAAIKL